MSLHRYTITRICVIGIWWSVLESGISELYICPFSEPAGLVFFSAMKSTFCCSSLHYMPCSQCKAAAESGIGHAVCNLPVPYWASSKLQCITISLYHSNALYVCVICLSHFIYFFILLVFTNVLIPSFRCKFPTFIRSQFLIFSTDFPGFLDVIFSHDGISKQSSEHSQTVVVWRRANHNDMPADVCPHALHVVQDAVHGWVHTARQTEVSRSCGPRPAGQRERTINDSIKGHVQSVWGRWQTIREIMDLSPLGWRVFAVFHILLWYLHSCLVNLLRLQSVIKLWYFTLYVHSLEYCIRKIIAIEH